MSQRSGGAWAAGAIYFAGIMLIVVGIFGALEGLSAIIKGTFFVHSANYFITVDATGWGWVHLIIGIVVAFAGFGVLQGQTWARVVGMVVASLSAVANFLFIPYYPFWAITLLAIDLWVIWALCVWHPEELT